MVFWKSSRPKLADDEAATAPVAPVRLSVQPTAPKASKPSLAVRGGLETADSKERGFDPYNSGAFNARDTWSRINRKK